MTFPDKIVNSKMKNMHKTYAIFSKYLCCQTCPFRFFVGISRAYSS